MVVCTLPGQLFGQASSAISTAPVLFFFPFTQDTIPLPLIVVDVVGYRGGFSRVQGDTGLVMDAGCMHACGCVQPAALNSWRPSLPESFHYPRIFFATR